jgi:hypothetical protein
MTPPDHHLPATLKPGQLATATDTHLVPAVIADAGKPPGATSNSSPPIRNYAPQFWTCRIKPLAVARVRCISRLPAQSR